MLEQPRFVNRGDVTADTFNNTNARILEINSKTGLYPLYVVYSIFRARCEAYSPEELTIERQNELWEQTVLQNVFVICKTPMAKYITRRTLVGYRDIPVNAHYFDDLINTMQNKQKQFIERILKPSYWKREGGRMTFDAVVGIIWSPELYKNNMVTHSFPCLLSSYLLRNVKIAQREL